jgi:trimethylamine:corrinoid methyltransferase-like protein
MVLDNEIIAGITRLFEGIGLHDLEEEVALIKANTPKGNFLKEAHTRREYPQHWRPSIFSRDTYETWQDKNSSIESACRAQAKDLLASHQPARLPASVEAELERILRREIDPGFSLEGAVTG